MELTEDLERENFLFGRRKGIWPNSSSAGGAAAWMENWEAMERAEEGRLRP